MASVWGKGKRKSAVVRTGSPWTNGKLDALATYLRSYTVAGLHTPGRKACIEAFVGTGYGGWRREDGGDSQELAMPALGASEPQAFLDAIARMILETNPAFHAYVFMDQSETRREAIENLHEDFAGIVLKNALRSDGATEEIGKMCQLDWKDRRAVMFLDPFGMHVEWETIEAIAQTKAIDLWILYPVGFGTERLANEVEGIPASWREHMNRFLGAQTWYKEFASAEPEPTLFPDGNATASARIAVLARCFKRRLMDAFSVVAEPRVLRGPTGEPLYVCSFALGSGVDAANAARFANKLLERLSA